MRPTDQMSDEARSLFESEVLPYIKERAPEPADALATCWLLEEVVRLRAHQVRGAAEERGEDLTPSTIAARSREEDVDVWLAAVGIFSDSPQLVLGPYGVKLDGFSVALDVEEGKKWRTVAAVNSGSRYRLRFTEQKRRFLR